MQSNPQDRTHSGFRLHRSRRKRRSRMAPFNGTRPPWCLSKFLPAAKQASAIAMRISPRRMLIDESLAPKLIGHDALANGGAWRKMVEQIRNLGRPGIASMAIAAVDNALWDLKGKLLNVSVAALLGMVRPGIMAYGSGGFTSYSDSQLREQLGGWAEAGFLAVKMKIGRDAAADIDRVHAAREAIGPKVQLFVDANGAYTRKQALDQAHRFRERRRHVV